MVHIKTLAPTIIDAVKAVERGCRRIQDDHYFTCNMATWMAADSRECIGCLATITLMQLSGKSASDITGSLGRESYHSTVHPLERSAVFGIEIDPDNIAKSDFAAFEEAIDFFRKYDLMPLLKFYGLQFHRAAYSAATWLLANERFSLWEETEKEKLIPYADFLKNELIPKMEAWFAPLE